MVSKLIQDDRLHLPPNLKSLLLAVQLTAGSVSHRFLPS